MDPNPELESQIEAFLFKEMPADERADFEKNLAADAALARTVEQRAEQARLMRRAFLRSQVQKSRTEFGVLDLPETTEGRTVSLFSSRWAMAAGLALALGAAGFWMWSQGEKAKSELAQTRGKTEALREELARKEAQKPAAEPKSEAAEPVFAEKEKPHEPTAEKKSAPKIAQNEPKKGSSQATDPLVYSTQSSNIRGSEAVKKGKGNAIFQSIGAEIDLEKVRSTQPALVKKVEQKRFDEVIAVLAKAELEDKNSGYYLAAVCHFERGDFKNAVAELDSLYFKSNPFYPEAKWLMALCRLREEKLEAAKELLTEISKNKSHPRQAAAAAALAKF